MRHDKLERELSLILLLTENNKYGVDELCDKVGISRRNLYYYLEFLRDCGFKVYKRGNCHCIDRDSPFFNRLFDRISFTEEEAILIGRLLDKAGRGNAIAAGLKNKLHRFYDLDILTGEEPRDRAVQSIAALHTAIKLKRQTVLVGYSSPHSSTTRDRFVEPFMLMNNNNEVRCYEPASGLNKTFKVSRMQSVEVLESPWTGEQHHRCMYTDIFMFSGEELLPVDMMLGRLSCSLLLEEYPRAAAFLAPPDGGQRRLTMNVCNYAGIGRFVLGLYDDITVLGGDGFKAYLRERIERMKAT